jgi:membrane protease YdiL (CAAX protease family)
LFIGVGIGIGVWGLGIFSSPDVFFNIENPQSINLLKLLQIFQSIGIFVVPPIILGYLFQKNIKSYLKLNFNPHFKTYILTVLIMIVSVPFINLLAELNSKIAFPDFLSSVEQWMQQKEAEATKITEAFLNVKTYSAFLLNVFMIAIIPAVGEEFLFRGVFQRIFADWTKNIHLGIIISAFFFSAMHVQFYGFFPRMLMGVLFGYLFVWSGSIWIPILAHFINNFFAILVSFFIYRGTLNKNVETFGNSSDTVVYAIISIAICVFLVYLFFNKRNRVSQF